LDLFKLHGLSFDNTNHILTILGENYRLEQASFTLSLWPHILISFTEDHTSADIYHTMKFLAIKISFLKRTKYMITKVDVHYMS